MKKSISDFFKDAAKFYTVNIGVLIRELFPHYTFSQNWELCSTNEMEDVLHIYKYWMGVELSHKEYVLKYNSLPLDEQEEIMKKRIHLLRRMYKELPEELQKEVVR